MYNTTATTSGGRDGRAVLEDGKLALAMALPKEMGGSGQGHNPEQLFALGWSACFGQAILVLARKHELDGQKARATVEVGLDKDDVSFALTAKIIVALPGADREKLRALADEAHEICPYSRATRGTIASTVEIA